MHNNRRNRIVVPEARQASNDMKNEIASELGVSNDNSIRQNGYTGGNISDKTIKKLQEQAEQQISDSIKYYG